jgi:hypothetical protein
VAAGGVHGLGDADVGADGRAEEVERPEGGDDTEVEFSVLFASDVSKGGRDVRGGGLWTAR